MSVHGGVSSKKVKLGTLADFLNGGTPSRKNEAYYRGHIPWITSADVNSEIAQRARYFITDEAVENSSTRIIPEGNLLLVTRTGVGKVAITGSDLCINQDFTAIIPKTKIVNVRYLFWFLKSTRNYFESHSRGATIQGITRRVVEDLEVPLPPLEQQKRIATILDKADELRAKRRRAIAKLDELLKSVFLELFSDPVTNPKGWEKRRLDSLGKVITGNTPSRQKPEFYGSGIEWIKSDNINTPLHYLTEADEHLSKQGEKVGRTAPPGSTLVTCIAGTPDCIGNAALANRKVAFNQQINAFVPSAGEMSVFYYTQFLIGKKLVQKASTNSMKGMVSKSAFSAIEFLYPPIELQRRFSQHFQSITMLTRDASAALEKSNILFSSLQARAFSGDLTPDALDEVEAVAASS